MADFSEDLYDSQSGSSNFAQQMAQCLAYDIVFSIPGSIGAVAEIHDFARIPELSHKITAFLDLQYASGYSQQSLVSAQINPSCKVELYDSAKLPECVIQRALDQTRRLQEFLYAAGRR
jgi:hypothetical protein